MSIYTYIEMYIYIYRCISSQYTWPVAEGRENKEPKPALRVGKQAPMHINIYTSMLPCLLARPNLEKSRSCENTSACPFGASARV